MKLTADKGWIDADPDEEGTTCEFCEQWVQCPCGCDWGLCLKYNYFTDSSDTCN